MIPSETVNDVKRQSAVELGGRVRRLRRTRRKSQTEVAHAVGISASYLNLIEHNRRKLTVELLFAIAGYFGVEPGELAAGDEALLVSDLMEAFSDALFADSDVTNTDVRDFAHTNPAIARAVISLYDRYRETRTATAASSRTGDEPFHRGTDIISDFLQENSNHFPTLEAAAERIRGEIDAISELFDVGVRAHLNNVYGVDVQVASLGSGIARQFDPQRGRLLLSDLCSPSTGRFLLAQQIGVLGAQREIEEIMASANLLEGDLPLLARNVLSGYAAAAIVMPYGPFLRACRDYRYDIERLEHRFGVSFEQVCHRMTTTQRRGESGIPFHLVRTDIAGNISKRFSLSGITMPRHSGACPKWNVYTAFLSPGRINIQISEMPDGTRYFCMAQAITKGAHRHLAQPRHLAVGVGCELSRARELVYADGIDLDSARHVVAVGTSCRICPRRECSHRAHPAIDHRVMVDENERSESYLGRIG
jgi:predicted transcriptional regulator/transcriptional regulator with XRE-family HTH domain